MQQGVWLWVYASMFTARPEAYLAWCFSSWACFSCSSTPLQTTLRSSMSGARLSELSFLAVHRDLALDFPKAIDEFARRHPRRMELRDLLID